MTDADDKLSRRYREASREEPPAHLDAAILAASRRAVGAGPRARKPAWMVPASIAAVLVLGIGVSLRMQLEQPGIETSAPAGSSEYPVPAAEPAQDAVAQAPAAPPPAPSPPPAPQARSEPDTKRRAQADANRNAQANAMREEPQAPKALTQRVEKRDAEAPAERALRKDSAASEPPASATVTTPTTTASPPAAAAPQAAMRPKLEGYAADTARERAPRAALAAAADPDPARELERIAKLREAGNHAEADRALEEFRRRHADYRIPGPVWDRVKPR
jgi:hypothetical protein